MFFQKLENLKKDNKLSKLSDIIDRFDFWLATRPKSYKNMLAPEQFSEAEEVLLEISNKLFVEAQLLQILEKRYVVSCCKCGHIVRILNTKDEAINYIIEYNGNEEKCGECDRHYNITSNNVHIYYNLKEKPNKKEFSLNSKYKKDINIKCQIRTLTDEVLESATENKVKYGDEVLSSIMPKDIDCFFEGL